MLLMNVEPPALSACLAAALLMEICHLDKTLVWRPTLDRKNPPSL